MDDALKLRTGCSIGAGIGGLPGIESESIVLAEKGPGRVSPHFVHGRLINLVGGQVQIKYGLMGPNHAVVTACSTGAHSIGDAARMIALDDADVMLAGGAESTVNPLGVAGFAQARALNTSYNDRPTEASRPYDKAREGFVMGEGAGVVVLEELAHARARGATIFGEVTGYGLSGDAYHVTAPHPEGLGAELAMRMALKKAGLGPGDIDYINAHGTSTMADTIELAAVKRVLGDDLGGASMSSTKSAIGHLLGGRGRGRSDLLPARDPRPDRAAYAQPHRPRRGHRRRRSRPARSEAARGQRGAQQQLRLRRHERLAGGPAGRMIRRSWLLVGAVGLFLAIALAWLAGGWWFAIANEEERTFIVPDGATLTSVAERLQEDGTIGSADTFLLRARLLGGSAPVKAGEFMLPASASQADILNTLQSGDVIRRFVTIPEGTPSVEVHDLLMAEPLLSGEIAVPAEGSVLPQTYDFERGETRGEVLARMQQAMEETVAELWPGRARNIAVDNPRDAVILASIVEKETGVPRERRMVAGLYSNRLRTGMMLQADPTIIYPITRGRPLGRRIRRSEIAAVNDYNTYSMVGLPKAPITNPGRESIAAVLNPAETDALFMVADDTGGHAFAETLTEHNRNVERWYAIRRARGRNVSADGAPLILTALLPRDLHAQANRLREQHFPPERNHLEAHVTLFHAIPGRCEAELTSELKRIVAEHAAPPGRLEGIMSLGRGTALKLSSPAMLTLRDRIAERFHGMLTAQDQHRPRLHVTVQNKVSPAAAKALQAALDGTIEPRDFAFRGIGLFVYRGGPWEAIREFAFRGHG